MQSEDCVFCKYQESFWESLKGLRISVIIPCYNEVHTIRQILAAVQSAPVKPHEIIIIDDGSHDGTRDVLKSEIQGKGAKVIYHEKNMGKGAAIRTGLDAFSGDIVIIQDADLEYDPQEYPRLLAPIVAGKADVVYGSRFMGADPHRVLYFWHWLGNKVLTLMSNAFSNLNLTDMETCYKVAKREVIQQISIQENRFGFEPEFTAKVAKLDCRIYEVGISYTGRTYKEGKKIGWKDGLSACRCIIKYNLIPQKLYRKGH